MVARMAKRKAKLVHPVIRRLRRLRGDLSQAEFARRLGINIFTLRKWEQGQVSPDATTVRFISLYLDLLEKDKK